MNVNRKQPVRILQLIDGLNVGGAEVLLRDLSCGLVQRGYQVQVGYSTPGPILADLAKANIPAQRLPRLARVDPLLLLRMIALIRQFQPQIVHTHLFKSDFHGRIAARFCRVPVILSTLHNSDGWARRWPLGAIYGLTARMADQLIAVSDEVGDYHRQYSKIDPQKIKTILNGIPAARFAYDVDAGQRVRQELGVAASAPLVGVIGRLKEQKDHATFLAAAALVSQQMPETRFWIVGDGPLRNQLENQAAGLGLAGSVRFCGVRSDIPALLSAMDVLAFSSLWEGLPLTLLEGMAAARPVVATAVDGICSVAVPGQTALLVQPGNARTLAEGCLTLLRDSDLRSRLGQAGCARVHAHYSLEAMIDQTDALYQSLLIQKSQFSGGQG